MKLGDTVLYTTPHGAVWVAIVVDIRESGKIKLAAFSPVEQRVVWLDDVKVTGASPGTEEAFGKWCHR